MQRGSAFPNWIFGQSLKIHARWLLSHGSARMVKYLYYSISWRLKRVETCCTLKWGDFTGFSASVCSLFIVWVIIELLLGRFHDILVMSWMFVFGLICTAFDLPYITRYLLNLGVITTNQNPKVEYPLEVCGVSNFWQEETVFRLPCCISRWC